jgi:Xaa-Pro aminopeptidase
MCMTVHLGRRDRLLVRMRDEGVDALLVSSPINVTYLTGFTGEASWLVLTAAKTILVSDGRFLVQLAEECPGLETVIRPPSQTIHDAAGMLLSKLDLRSVGYESSHLTVNDFEVLRSKAGPLDWKSGSDRVEKLRIVKDAGELVAIRRAVDIAQQAFVKFRASLSGAQTEKQLHDAMEFSVREAGGKTTAFPTIVAVGPRAALPHAPPTRRKLSADPFFLCDWGADEGLYKSDLTRMLWTGKTQTGPVFDKLMHVVDIVQQARKAAIAKMHPGALAKDVDAAARSVIEAAGFGPQFNHGLGHGIGLQIHEAPFLRSSSDVTLEAGMVITVEPGIYLPGELGVRIEDDIWITPDGPEMLTSVPESPVELAAAL